MDAICSAQTWERMCRMVPPSDGPCAVRIHVIQDEAERAVLAERLASQGRDVIHIR